MNVQQVSKAIAGALVGVIIAWAARYGFHANDQVINALDVLVTTGVSMVVGYLAVYFAPKNKP